MSLSAAKNCTGIFRCFTDFGYRRILCIREVGDDVLSEFICLTVQIKLIGVPSCVRQTSWYRKKTWIRGGSWSVTIFRQKSWVAHCRNCS